MKKYQVIALTLALLGLGSYSFIANGEGKTSSTQPMKCESGPLTKTFGGAQWFVYGCSDALSIAVISAPGSPAMPFYFFLSPAGNGYAVSGEGNGNKATTDAALKDLEALSVTEIRSLIEQARAVQKAR